MEAEVEQLVSMGFTAELAAEALAATGGKSTLKATEWLLSNHQHHTRPSNHPQHHQPRLDRFFLSDKRPRPTPNACSSSHKPLSERMRPLSLNDVVGHPHVLSLLSSSLRNPRRLPSLLLWGPPGSGKTSLARSLASSSLLSHLFLPLSAVTAGVKDIREAADVARQARKADGKGTLLFVDEVHRFSKSQQDSLLPLIEDGTVVFVGATTENPSFHLVTPLLSRCRVLALLPLKPPDVRVLLERAIRDTERGLLRSLEVDSSADIEVRDDAVGFLSENCDGDARVALNALEVSAVAAAARVKQGDKVIIALDDAKEAMQCKHVAYDRDGEEHYNLISALHKSMRGGDADAAIYWLTRMLEGGEQPLYIARRLVRFASEDIGLADTNALNQAVSCYQACHFLGMPECDVVLAQCVAYLALAPKSIAVYKALGTAKKAVQESFGQNEGVPLHLRNAPTKLMKEMGYGKGYIYTPDDPSAEQSFLPPSLRGHKFLDWPIRNNTHE
ncbi:hypothetical protein MLD38_023969 [Melastoma candidum]|uniref:Uncharacterized protein n=2 Tax=Melastoma candidum TaxID=119954 RepID=A0ACB9NS48_9MYRT|nr:hypothetical protein MLD38_023969 [Melastoma candidum]